MKKRISLSIKNRLIVIIIIPLLVISVITGFILNIKIRNSVFVSTKKATESQLNIYADFIQSWLDGYYLWLRHNSNKAELKQKMTLEQASLWLLENALKDKHVLGMAYTNAEGEEVAVTGNKIKYFSVKDREFYQAFIRDNNLNTFIGRVILNRVTGSPIVMVVHALRDKSGNFLGLLGLALELSRLKEFATKENFGKNNIASIFEKSSGMILAHPSDEIMLTNIQDMDKNFNVKGATEFYEGILKGDNINAFPIISSLGEKSYIIWKNLSETGWILAISLSDITLNKLSREIFLWYMGITIFSLIVLIIIIVLVLERYLKPIQTAVSTSNTIANFNLSDTNTNKTYSNDELGNLSFSMDTMANKLKTILKEIQLSGEYVTTGSKELQTTSQLMSQQAGEQAATLEQLASSAIEIENSIRSTTTNAQETETITQTLLKKANESGIAVSETAVSMNQIAEKISVIQEISAQTRLLSLNASIEAARAGNAGKGFAVVASEVSKLAELSTEAATAIEELTSKSVNIANEAGEKLKVLVPEIKKTTDLVTNISLESQNQNSSIGEITTSIQQVNQVVQQNASQAEELASTAQNFLEHAEQLQKIVSLFKF